MKKNIVISGIAAVLILGFVFSGWAQDLVWQEIARGNADLSTVLVDSDYPQVIYIGSSRGVFKTEDSAATWRNILSVKGQNKAVNVLLYGPTDKNSLYAATREGLFYSSDQGRNWRRIFKGKNYFERECTALAILADGIYLGTKAGLFVSKDRGRSWQRDVGTLGKNQILAIACDLKGPYYPECSNLSRSSSGSRSNTSQNNEIRDIYVACVEGVFRTQNSGQSWERIFVASPTEDGKDNEEETEDRDEEERFSRVRYIQIDPNLHYLYLATSEGVYKSKDRGQTWELISNYGLLNKDIKFLLVSPKSQLFAVAKSGIFEYKTERWEELSLRLVAEEIRFLILDNQNNFYAACDKGLFKTNLGGAPDEKGDSVISLYSKDEPQINAIQQAAIKYAEVEPEKIKEWRRKAKMKAILPRLTVGLDRSENTNYEIYTSATTHYVYEGPDDKSNGWDATLTWELGDLIWNDDQTSIDVRSRLMVQLRDDILDEVTKLYFERLRVKIELDNLSIEDRKKRVEKELRLQELSASLDALTGGYFSQQLQNIKSKIGS